MNHVLKCLCQSRTSIFKAVYRTNQSSLRLFNFSSHILYSTSSKPGQDDDVSFGVGGRFTDLDIRRVGKEPIGNKNLKFQAEKLNQAAQEEEVDEQFGTLSNALDDISVKTKLSRLKVSTGKKYPDDIVDDTDQMVEYKKPLHRDHEKTDEYYARTILELADKKKVDEAIDFFFNVMIEKDRFKPTSYLYNQIIKICVYNERFKLAFDIFEQIKASGEVNFERVKMNRIMTLLVYACSRLPNKQQGLEKLNYLRGYMRENNMVPTALNYDAIIGAYGRLNNTVEAFAVADEMLRNRIKPSASFYASLLYACNGQKVGGFQSALFVWRRMLKKRHTPAVAEYNALLRALRFCTFDENMKEQRRNLTPKDHKHEPSEIQAGDTKKSLASGQSQVTEMPLKKSSISGKEPVLQLSSDEVHVIDELQVIGKSIGKKLEKLEWWQDASQIIDKVDVLQEIANMKPELSKKFNEQIAIRKHVSDLLTDKNVASIESGLLVNDTPEDRLALVGGIDGICSAMRMHKTKPSIDTFRLLLDCATNTSEAEVKVMDELRKFKVQLETDFCNKLIERRAQRNDTAGVKDAMRLLQENELKPNNVTLGSLAKAVSNTNELKQFIDDSKNFGIPINEITITTLISRGFYRYSKSYYKTLFAFVNKQRIEIPFSTAKRIDLYIESLRNDIIEAERKYRKMTPESMGKEEHNLYILKTDFYSYFQQFFTQWRKDHGKLIVDERFVIKTPGKAKSVIREYKDRKKHTKVKVVSINKKYKK